MCAAEAVCIIPAVKTSLVTEFWESGVPTSVAIQLERMRENCAFVADVFIKLLVAYCSVEGCQGFLSFSVKYMLHARAGCLPIIATPARLLLLCFAGLNSAQAPTLSA